jgi:hypothetical protein
VGGINNTGHMHLFQRTGTTTDVLGLGSQPFNAFAFRKTARSRSS